MMEWWTGVGEWARIESDTIPCCGVRRQRRRLTETETVTGLWIPSSGREEMVRSPGLRSRVRRVE